MISDLGGPAPGAANAVVLFDGVCRFCNGTVSFILARDAKQRFRFAPLQSPTGREILRGFGLPTDRLDTMVLVEDGRCYTKSTALLRVLRRLSGFWPWLYVLILLPRAVRDFSYDRFARRRYRWFGKLEQCLVPSPEIRSRFLE